jgi:large-conductance mechanosensitive channel
MAAGPVGGETWQGSDRSDLSEPRVDNEAAAIPKDFKEFALRGNVVNMAVGIIIGASFSTIVKSLVDDINMPPFGVLMVGGGVVSNMFIPLKGSHYDSLAQARQAAPTLNFGDQLPDP